MPGPPAGPSLRMTTTSPASISPAVTAAIASSSPSKTRAGPSWWRRSWPASLTTQPSGARLPRRIARPPVGLIGSSSGRTTSWPWVSRASRGVLADRLAGDGRRVLVQQPGLDAGAGRATADAAGGVQVGGDVAPAGLEVAEQSACARRCGRSRRSSSSTPASRAIASRCRTPLVEPPLAATAAIAFSSDVAGDDVARAQAAGEHVHDELAGLVGDRRPWSASSAGTIAEPIGEMPSISKAIAIVLAVNWPPQAPAPGEAASSSSVSSSSVDLAGGVRADRLEDVLDRDVAALVAAGRDRAAVEHHRRGRRGARAPSRCRGSSCRSR